MLTALEKDLINQLVALTPSFPIPSFIEIKSYIKAENGSPQVPIGTIISLLHPPSGWLECNGQTFDPKVYPKLAEVLSVPYRSISPEYDQNLACTYPNGVARKYPFGENRVPDLRGRKLVQP